MLVQRDDRLVRQARITLAVFLQRTASSPELMRRHLNQTRLLKLVVLYVLRASSAVFASTLFWVAAAKRQPEIN